MSTTRSHPEIRRFAAARLSLGLSVVAALPAARAETLPRIEDFRLDLTAEEIRSSESRHARSVACQAYLYQFPALLHLRQLSEILQARSHLSPGETALGGWMLIRDLSTPKTANTMPNVDTLYGAAFVWLEKQGPVVLTIPPVKQQETGCPHQRATSSSPCAAISQHQQPHPATGFLHQSNPRNKPDAYLCVTFTRHSFIHPHELLSAL